MASGIYKILNNETQSFYVGSAADLFDRWATHRANLRQQKHGNIHLQRSWDKHGEDKFAFIVIQVCAIEQLRAIEQLLLDEHCGKFYCYNIAKNAERPAFGLKQSKETVEKRRNALRGRILSEDHKQKIGKANKGNIIGEEGRRNMAVARVGRKLSESHKKNIGLRQQGEESANAKLTNDDVLSIREEYAMGVISSRALAKKYNLKDKTTIMNIVKRKTWKHI